MTQFQWCYVLCSYTTESKNNLFNYTDFDHLAVANNLKTHWGNYCKLPYNSMKYYLKENSVITTQEKAEIDRKVGTEQMDKLLTIVQTSLELEQSEKYKGFLKSMEQSDDVTLRRTAKNLGEPIRRL